MTHKKLLIFGSKSQCNPVVPKTKLRVPPPCLSSGIYVKCTSIQQFKTPFKCKFPILSFRIRTTTKQFKILHFYIQTLVLQNCNLAISFYQNISERNVYKIFGFKKELILFVISHFQAKLHNIKYRNF